MRIEDIPGNGERAVACAGCGYTPLTIVDRYVTDFPPIPRGNPESFIEFYRDTGGDPDDRVLECPGCGEELELSSVIMNYQAVIDKRQPGRITVTLEGGPPLPGTFPTETAARLALLREMEARGLVLVDETPAQFVKAEGRLLTDSAFARSEVERAKREAYGER